MSGQSQGQRILLDRPVLLGRDPQSRVLFDDEMISRHHALIESLDGQLVIRDLGSKNGTFVNGQEAEEAQFVKVNDRIRLGKTLIALIAADDPLATESSSGVETRGGHGFGPDSDWDPANPEMEEKIQISRRDLRRATELSGKVSALCRLRHSLGPVVSTIRREFRADAAGAFLIDPLYEPAFVEGPVSLTPEHVAVLDAVRRRTRWRSFFLPDPGGDRQVMVMPLMVDEEVRAVLLLRREAGRAFEDGALGFADTVSECLRAVPLRQALSDGAAGMLPDNLGIVGSSDVINRAREQIRTYAGASVTVLIRGESGTGKELCARGLWQLSGRRFAPFLEVNCACMMPELIESELFGHERGAFTGAASRRIGKIELANGGTLFLDEIGEMPMELQAKLLRVFEGQPFYRLGGTELIRSDVRFLCATNRDLERMVEEGRFRRDLYHRVNVLSMDMPPLRERLEDISELVPYLISRMQEDLNGQRRYTVTPKAYRRLLSHAWPGNVRELQNVIQRIVLLNSGTVIDEEQIPPEIGEDHESTTIKLPRLQVLTEMMEREEITRALLESKGHKSQAARTLGISRPTLDKKIKSYGLNALTIHRRRDGDSSGPEPD